jgi:hypothetical protein
MKPYIQAGIMALKFLKKPKRKKNEKMEAS